MGKKKIIGFIMGLAMICATASAVSACDFIDGSSGTNSSSSSSETPVSVEYKVTFDSAGGSSVRAQYVTKGEKAQKPAENPTREGYTFVEWQLNGNSYDFNTDVVGDITLKAKWEKNEPTKFVVSFMVEGETAPFYTAEVATGKKAMKPAEVPTRAGYVFDCWTLNGVEFDFETPITQELTLVAKWSNLWTITYDAGEATPFYTLEVVEGAVVTAPTEVPTREGYVFDCWTLNGVEFDFETPVTQAFTLVAKWINAWVVTFDVGEGNPIDPAMVKDGDMVSMPEGQREGYYVTDWLLNGESFNFATPITENITLTAVWDTDGLYSNQIGIRICGNDVSGQSKWMNKETDDKGATVITATFQADATYSPALVLREVFSKEYYQGLIELGYTRLTFNLAIEGDITDLYIFGKPITSFVKNNGVYAVVVSLQHIVNHYDTIYTLATSANQAGQATSLSAKFLSWKSPANDYTSTKNYIFTISDIAVSDTFFDFAEGSAATIYTGETTTLEVNTNVIGDVVWSSSDATIATVEDGVVTGLKAGEVTITATLNGLTASKTVKVIYHNQIGARINGNDVTANMNYLQVTTDETGTTVITTKFQADATYSPALTVRHLADKAVYEGMIAEGKTSLMFNLAVEGDVSDLYVFGKALNTFPEIDGVYAVVVSLQRIVEYYETIKTLATSANQAGQASSLPAKFITWKSPANDYTSVRNYVFTITDVVIGDTAEPTLSVEFAEGSADTIYVNGTTTLTVNTNVAGDVVWSSSDERVATVANGVVTGVKAGEVTVTATLGDLTASKTVKVIYHNQIGARINGNDVTANMNYLQVTAGENGATVITAKFQADATYSPALTVRHLADKAVYEGMIAEGKTSLTFNLAVDGDVSDLYIFGKALSSFPNTDGVYAVVVSLQRIVEHYETIKALATSANQAGQASSLPAKFITWKSPAADWSTVRDYVFTISDVVLGDTAEPTFSVEFAEGSADTIYVNGTTTLEVNTNVAGDVVWSSSDATIATVEDGVVTGLKAGEVTITATLNGLTTSKTIKVIYHNQIGVHAYGWDQTGNATYFNMSKSDNGETIIAVQFAGSKTHYPSLTLKDMYNQEYCQGLIAEGYAKLTFNLKVGGANASDVSDLYIFGKKLTNFAKNAEGVYAIVVDLQFMVDYYDKVSGMGTSVEAKNAEFNYMFLAWKSDVWTNRNYEFTFSNVSLRKGALFSDNIGMRVNGGDETTDTTYMQMDVAADGAMTITANWEAYANYGPALVLKNMQSKEYYQGLIGSGYTHLTFDLKVGGADADKLDDIHILGSAQKVSACEQVNGVYKVQIQLAHIVQFYDTIVTLDTSEKQAGQWSSRSALLLAWRFSTNFATVPDDATRNYVFTISNTAFSKVN